VQFGEDGKVAQLIGTQLPSRNQAVTDDPPPAKAAKQTHKAAQKKKR
jgi:hypothetical protein